MGSCPDPASIEHRHLRSAIEYAVLMGDEITKRGRRSRCPRELRAVAGKARIPTGSLGRLRRAIDGDDTFRSAIAAGALPELVDPIGILWLQRPDGWESQVEQLRRESRPMPLPTPTCAPLAARGEASPRRRTGGRAAAGRHRRA